MSLSAIFNAKSLTIFLDSSSSCSRCFIISSSFLSFIILSTSVSGDVSTGASCLSTSSLTSVVNILPSYSNSSKPCSRALAKASSNVRSAVASGVGSFFLNILGNLNFFFSFSSLSCVYPSF